MRAGAKKRIASKRMVTPQSSSLAQGGGPIEIGLVCVFLVMIVAFIFGQTLRHDFINFDDNLYVTENPHVLNGLNWADIKWAFTTQHTGYSHPITWLSHQLDCQLYGTWAGGHHLTSICIHAINAILLFLLLFRTTGSFWSSAFVAELFAIHPLHIESVAWIAERKDVLSALFFFLTLHAFVSYVVKPTVGRYLLTFCLYLLGILSKPMLVTLPFLLLLLDYWPLRRLSLLATGDVRGSSNLGKLILEKLPLVLIAVLWSVVTFAMQKGAGALVESAHVQFSHRLANAVASYGMYVWNTFWPHDLALFYPYPRTVRVKTVIISAVLIAFVSVACFGRRRSSPYFLTGWLWFLGMLVPVIGLIQVGGQSRADRYTYLPQIGLFLLITWGAIELVRKWQRGHEILIAGAVLVIIALTVDSYFETSFWRDSERLWNRTLTNTSKNHVAQNNFGNALMDKGELDDAIIHFRESVEIFPDYPEAHNNLGVALAGKDHFNEAIASYRVATRLRPRYAEAHNNLAISLARSTQTEEAVTEFQEALRIDNDLLDGHYNFGVLLAQLGRRDEATAQFKEVLRLKPGDPEATEQLQQLGVNK